MTTQVENVEVKVGRLEADWRKFGVLISVRSQKKNQHKLRIELDPGKFASQAELLEAVGRAGGTLAEAMDRRFNENADIFQCVHYAQRAFLEEMRMMAEIKKDAPAKLKRLREHQADLNNAEQELVKRLEWHINKGNDITPNEAHAINVMISRVHGKQL